MSKVKLYVQVDRSKMVTSTNMLYDKISKHETLDINDIIYFVENGRFKPLSVILHMAEDNRDMAILVHSAVGYIDNGLLRYGDDRLTAITLYEHCQWDIFNIKQYISKILWKLDRGDNACIMLRKLIEITTRDRRTYDDALEYIYLALSMGTPQCLIGLKIPFRLRRIIKKEQGYTFKKKMFQFE